MTDDPRETAVLTPEGRARLRAELDSLRTEREPALAALLRQQREEGNAWEASGYYLALQEELAQVQHRIRALEAALASEPEERAPPPTGAIDIGSRVTVRDDTGRELTYVLVSPLEADPSRGHISSASPVGAGLVGHRAGDVVQVKTPAGLRTLTILRVE